MNLIRFATILTIQIKVFMELIFVQKGHFWLSLSLIQIGLFTNLSIKAGVAWINLVKQAWNSTMTSSVAEMGIKNIYHGVYDLELVDTDGNVVDTREITVDKKDCDLYGASNLLQNGDFENFDNWGIQENSVLAGKPGFHTIPSWSSPELTQAWINISIKLEILNLILKFLKYNF